MANFFLRSTDGADTDNGSTWALADATISKANPNGGSLPNMAAGDTLYVSDNHAESTAAAITLTSPGTAASPVRILCVDDTGDPASPTTLATTATVTTTGASNVNFTGVVYWYGIAFKVGTGASSASAVLGSNSSLTAVLTYESCAFEILNTGTASASIQVGSNTNVAAISSVVTWIDVRVKFSATAQAISPAVCAFSWHRGSLDGAGTIPTALLDDQLVLARGTIMQLSGVDLSALTTAILRVASIAAHFTLNVQHCKLASGVVLATGAPVPGVFARLDNCDSADTNYRMQRHQYQGDVYSETVVVRNGGATDGTTRLAWRMVTSANSKLYSPLPSPRIRSPRNTAVGSAKTLTISLIHDGAAALNDDEVWIEVEYLGTAGFPLSLFADDAVANILATPAAQATDTGSDWDDLVTARANITAYSIGDFIKVASNLGRVFRCTTTGTSAGSEPAGYATAADGDSVTDNTAVFRAMRRQAVSVAVTPQEIGPFFAIVHLAKASYTVYVDPLIVVTGDAASARQSLVPGGEYINEDAGGTDRAPRVRTGGAIYA